MELIDENCKDNRTDKSGRDINTPCRLSGSALFVYCRFPVAASRLSGFSSHSGSAENLKKGNRNSGKLREHGKVGW